MIRAAWLVVVVAFAVVVLAPPTDASAHAALAASDPRPNAFLQRAPARISLTFTEPIDSDLSNLQLLDALGQPVRIGAVSFSDSKLTMQAELPPQPPGIYNVVWTNVSTIDGHGLQGSFPYTVLNPDGSVPDVVNTVGNIGSSADAAPLADGVATRALSLLGLAIVASGAFLLLLLDETVADRHRKGFQRAILFGGAVLAVATLLNLETLRNVYAGESLNDLIFHSRAGGFWLTRLGAVAMTFAIASFIAESRRMSGLGILMATGIYLWAFSATSHAAAGTGSNWAIAIDLVHGMTAILWIGAVIGVALTARLAGRNAHYKTLMPRFGLAASMLVFGIVATGILGAFVELDTFDRLWTTRYGWTLVAKIALLVPLLAVAFWNARWGRRRVESGTTGGDRLLTRTALLEAGLGGLVFVAAAMLTQTTASKSVVDVPGSEPFAQELPANDLAVGLNIDPNITGMNTYRVRLADQAGQPVDADRVTLTFRYRDDDSVGPSTLDLAATPEAGISSGQGPFLTLEGRWRVEVRILRPNVDDATAFFDVRPAGPAVTSVTRGGPWANPAPGLTWNQFGGFIALLAGLALAIWGNRLGRLGKPLGWANNAATMACFGFGALLLFGVHNDVTPDATLDNPITPDQNSISQGRTLYQANCVACHGDRGVPPRGLDLNPYPLDLTVHVPQHTDGQIFSFIKNGVAGSAMVAWGEADPPLSDEQIWHLVNFLRTLGTVDE